ncbi:MAG: hypothetical protein R2864_01970 [Syntrophotaleaceae bacterium]
MPPDYEIDFATQGEEALAMVEQARDDGRPYALAFVDGRMPPGWDGIETIQHLWESQSRIADGFVYRLCGLMEEIQQNWA